jgi:predicted nucleic acid-binding Zn ribbon protein
MENYPIKICQSCGTALSGRLDKKFCSDQCRSTFNNRSKREYEKDILAINSSLRRNRTILKSLCPTGKATVRRETLTEMGFSFHTFSSIYHSKKGLTYYFSYEFGYAPIQEYSVSEKQQIQKVLIIQKQDFMDKAFDPWKQYSI